MMTEIVQEGDVTTIRLLPTYDSLDEDRTSELASLLLAQTEQNDQPVLLLDMRETEFIGSRFIEVVFRAWKRAIEKGGRLALAGVRPFCRAVLRAARVEDLFAVHADFEQGLEAIRRG